jgi:outer membrane protein, heavy metal efflux system
MKKYILSGWLLANCFFVGFQLSAQTDAAPQTISYQQLQEQVVQKNLQLVAAYYDIKIADAQARQAKLWRNPLFVWNQDLYSIELNQYMNFNNQRLIQVEQSFSIAGKHTNTVKLAKMNIELSKLAVADIIRGLLYEASIQYTNLQTLQEKEKLYDFSIQQMEDLLKTVTEQVAKGNIAGNELMRLKTELLDLYTQQDAVKSEMETAAGQIRLLTAMTENTPIRVEQRIPRRLQTSPATNQLRETKPQIAKINGCARHQFWVSTTRQGVKLCASLFGDSFGVFCSAF